MPETFESLDWVRQNYAVPAEVGMRVRHGADVGTIVGGIRQYVGVRFDGRDEADCCHPLSLDYGDGVTTEQRHADHQAHVERVNEFLNEKPAEQSRTTAVFERDVVTLYEHGAGRTASTEQHDDWKVGREYVPRERLDEALAEIARLTSSPAAGEGRAPREWEAWARRPDVIEAAARAVHEVSDDVLPFELAVPEHLGNRQRRAAENREERRRADYYGAACAVLAAVVPLLPSAPVEGGEREQGDDRTIFEETIAEVARDLLLDEEELRGQFERWLALAPGAVDPDLQRLPTVRAACYAAYRLIKLKTALRGAGASRRRWRDRALAAEAAAPHPVEGDGREVAVKLLTSDRIRLTAANALRTKVFPLSMEAAGEISDAMLRDVVADLSAVPVETGDGAARGGGSA